MRKYSKSTGTSYIVGLHQDIPFDAVDISDECYERVIGNPAPGKVRSHDAIGLPILIEPLPITRDQFAVIERLWRDAQINQLRWLRERHRDEVDSARPTTLTVEQSTELLDYVQALRDWPIAPDFPRSDCRPVGPSWVVDQNR